MLMPNPNFFATPTRTPLNQPSLPLHRLLPIRLHHPWPARAWAVGLISAAIAVPVLAGAGATASSNPTVVPKGWLGTWRDAAGGTAAIRVGDGVLRVWGADAHSYYRSSCALSAQNPGVAECAGEGYNHVQGFEFVYRSRMQLQGGVIEEQWSALAGGNTVEGRSRFTLSALPKAGER
ncbi:hypothetical protein [Sphaerotilus microaerophilus]|uniref:Uncharacterized protein n=1 Tax=Sphaerotilus microaerophilus TaxID=2914710 RepID=A0ABM7YNE4_9BURK|nr:hypothetical protein [Sphaerotilus sp. FB-5]BDI05989.1 hypothetical protein CATMQ487_29590 [Sphaerotilus sp. FB-5]